jgi:hypothetical protein
LQLEYAALDAAVLVHIFHHFHNHSQSAGFPDGHDKIEWKSHIVRKLQVKACVELFMVGHFVSTFSFCCGFLYRFLAWITPRKQKRSLKIKENWKMISTSVGNQISD